MARERRNSSPISRSRRTKASCWSTTVMVTSSGRGSTARSSPSTARSVPVARSPDDQGGAGTALWHEVAPVGRGDRGLGGDPAGLRGLELLEQLVHAGLQRLDPRLQLDDPLDARQVDAVLLGQPLHLAQQCDVAGAVTAATAGGAARA